MLRLAAAALWAAQRCLLPSPPSPSPAPFPKPKHPTLCRLQCRYKPEELDHSMVLVGYGTSSAGDYWEVKNSWSTHWGDQGHFKVLRDGHACGVASDAAYAVVADGAR